MMMIDRIAILGVGLLGGSLGLALKAGSTAGKIVGFGHRQSSLNLAMEIGAVDEATLDLACALADADLVVLATPVGLFDHLLEKMAPHLKKGAIVTDVGSAKQIVVRSARKHLPRNVHFVGAHPMTGSEMRGVEYARADLFAGGLCILTPTSGPNNALKQVDDFWKKLGMRTTRLTPARHDRIIARVSHLPHAVAGCLITTLCAGDKEFVGAGFMDTTRIASGDPKLWRDIFLANAGPIARALDATGKKLQQFAHQLDKADASAIERILTTAKTNRDAIMQEKLTVSGRDDRLAAGEE